MEQEKPPEEKLRMAMRLYMQMLCEQGNLASVLLLEYRSLEKDMYAHHTLNRDRFEKMWRDLVREGVDAGRFQCESVSITVWALLGIMNWTITWYRPDGKLSVDKIADQFADLFFDGIKSRRRNR
jgi:hypothetical protein